MTLMRGPFDARPGLLGFACGLGSYQILPANRCSVIELKLPCKLKRMDNDSREASLNREAIARA
jgi:hypothetical protein